MSVLFRESLLQCRSASTCVLWAPQKPRVVVLWRAAVGEEGQLRENWLLAVLEEAKGEEEENRSIERFERLMPVEMHHRADSGYFRHCVEESLFHVEPHAKQVWVLQEEVEVGLVSELLEVAV